MSHSIFGSAMWSLSIAIKSRRLRSWMATSWFTSPTESLFLRTRSRQRRRKARGAVKELGAVSVRNLFLPDGKWLHEPEYDALWNLACELDFPIAVHGEYRQRRFQPFRKLEAERHEDIQLALRGLDHALGFPCDNMTTLGHFIFTGILERFPKLRLAILESNC